MAKLFAWSVHLITASGAVWGLLALLSISIFDWTAAFAWMFVALFVDSFDGMLARWARVKEVTPGFDGDLLDNMLDYLTYVIVPAFLLYKAQLLPPTLMVIGVAVICLASAYQFCQSDAKTDDHFFKGFPSYWNVLAFYLFVAGLDPLWNMAIVSVLAALVFVPIKWIYPSRIKRWRLVTMAATVVWGLLMISMLLQFPDPDPRLLYASSLYVAYYMGVSLYLSFADRKAAS